MAKIVKSEPLTVHYSHSGFLRCRPEMIETIRSNVMNSVMQKRALATREAHEALLDLKRVVEEAAKTTHAAELEAVHLAIDSKGVGDITAKVRFAIEGLKSPAFDVALRRALHSLQTAIS